MKKLVGGFGKKSCFSTGVRKPGNTYARKPGNTYALPTVLALNPNTNQPIQRSPLCLTLYSILLTLTHQQQTAIEKIVGKEEIARQEQFLLFPQRFLLNQKIVSPFVHIFDVISLFAAELQEHKIGISGKGLTIDRIMS